MLYKMGIPPLDSMLKDMLDLPSLLVIAGHPGAGKTTFASKICHANASEGKRCLYITLQEDKDKLLRILKNLGMDFSELEKNGNYKLVKLPIVKEHPDEILNFINQAVAAVEPTIIVIDSVNALLSMIDDVPARSVFQNYFYTLPRVINGLVILVAEIPFGAESLDLGNLEFVADAVFILKHKIERGRLIRTLELRKVRGAPIQEAEIPFSIVRNEGIKLYVSPILERIGEKGELLYIPCKELKEGFGFMKLGDHLYSYYPAAERPLEGLMLAFGLAVLNNKRFQVISYRYSSESLKTLIWRGTRIAAGFFQKEYNVEIDMDKLKKTLDDFLEKNTMLVGINAFAYSLQELFMHEMELINKTKADIIMFHGGDIIEAVVDPKEYIPLHFNEIHLLKSMGKLVIKADADYTGILKHVNASIADLIVEWRNVPCDKTPMKECYVAILWGRGGRRKMVDTQSIWYCIADGLEPLIKQAIIG